MIRTVLIAPGVHRMLQRQRLLKKFEKAVHKIKRGENAGVDLKKRTPHILGIWQFRITQKYRAFAKKDGDTLTVFVIDDHQ